MDTFQQNNQLLLFDEALMLLDDNPAQEEQQNEYAMVLDGANDVNEEKDNEHVGVEQAQERPQVEDQDELSIKLTDEDKEVRLRMRLLLAHFNQDQLDRYEAMRRASLPKSVIRRLIHQFTGVSVNQNVVIAMAGMVKIFIGELVEEALDIQQNEDNRDDDSKSPLTPRHLNLALNSIYQKGGLFPAEPRKCKFLCG